MNIKSLAKLLARESIGADGNVDAKKVAAVCEYIDGKISPMKKIPLLREYAKIIKPMLAREEATIEMSGDISDETYESLKAFVCKEASRKNIRFQKIKNKEILGGVKIICGDNIWERTIINSLESLTSQ